MRLVRWWTERKIIDREKAYSRAVSCDNLPKAKRINGEIYGLLLKRYGDALDERREIPQMSNWLLRGIRLRRINREIREYQNQLEHCLAIGEQLTWVLNGRKREVAG